MATARNLEKIGVVLLSPTDLFGVSSTSEVNNHMRCFTTDTNMRQQQAMIPS
jgi:hypothetical protein